MGNRDTSAGGGSATSGAEQTGSTILGKGGSPVRITLMSADLTHLRAWLVAISFLGAAEAHFHTTLEIVARLAEAALDHLDGLAAVDGEIRHG